ncbi:MAG: hypothetical protein WKF87_06620 [Chryseolinea sp.]
MTKGKSWVIVHKETGVAVLETYSHTITLQINTDKFSVIPILQYLQDLNKRIKNSKN